VQITRRQFLKYVSAAAATVGLSQFELQKAMQVLAKDSSAYKVIWLNGQSCTGCTMSFSDLISMGPTSLSVPDHFDVGDTLSGVGVADDVLRSVYGAYPECDTLDDVLLTVIDLEYMETVTAAQGALAMDYLLGSWTVGSDPDTWTWPEIGGGDIPVLCVEGAVPCDGTDAFGRATIGEEACCIGVDSVGTAVTVKEAVNCVARKAAAVISVGQCASFGGIPASYSNTAELWTGTNLCNARGVQGALATGSYPYTVSNWGSGGTNPKLINVPGCPPHPDWIYGTIVRIVLQLLGVATLTVDSVGRPAPYYSYTIHGPGGCPRYDDYNSGFVASRLGDKGCLGSIGCYGMSTHSDCARRGWNNSRNNMSDFKSFCIAAGHPCISCTEPGYPFKINTNG